MLTTLKLGEFIQKYGGSIQTGPFGSQLHQSDYRESGTPVIMPKDIIDDRVDITSIAKIDDVMLGKLSRHILSEGDIVYPRRGDLNKRAFITSREAGWLCGTGCVKISLQGTPVFPLYLFYFLKRPDVVRFIENKAVGATMPNLSSSLLADIDISYPPLPQQRRIAAILSAYDDLIENNTRRIALLEESMRLLYREWFVRLRFPGHEGVNVVDGLPEGWSHYKVSDILQTLPRLRKIQNSEYLIKGSIPVVDQGADFIGGYTMEEEAKYVSPLPVIVFGDHTRRLKFIDFPFASGADGTQLLIPQNSTCSAEYLYFALQELDLSNYAYARHFKYLKEKTILIPEGSVQNRFWEVSSVVLAQISVLRFTNKKLSEARDLLLPRLMSGSISV